MKNRRKQGKIFRSLLAVLMLTAMLVTSVLQPVFAGDYEAQEDELDELQAKTESVLNYIPLKRFTLCLPDANALLSPSEADEEKQWETVRLGMEMAARIFS